MDERASILKEILRPGRIPSREELEWALKSPLRDEEHDGFRGPLLNVMMFNEWVESLEEPATLEGLNLSGANLNYLQVRRLRLVSCDLSGCSALRSSWEEVHVEGSNLRGMDLSLSSFRGLRLRQCDARDCRLDGSMLDGVCFERCALERASLCECTVVSTSLSECKGAEVELSFSICNELSALYCDLRGLRAEGMSLLKGEFQWSNLERSHLEMCSLQDLRLWHCRLGGASFSESSLANLSLRRCKFKDTRLSLRELQLLGPLSRRNPSALLLEEVEGEFEEAHHTYSALEENYRGMGELEERDLAFLRKNEAKRMMAKRNGRILEYLYQTFMRAYSSYGTSPVRIVASSVGVMFLCALYYWLSGGLDYGPHRPSFTSALYFSAITFATIGYGDVVPLGSARVLAAIEGFWGFFSNSYFLVVLARRLYRD